MATSKKGNLIAGLAVVGLAGLAGSALAANITATGSNAGRGEVTNEGYNITNTDYGTQDISGVVTVTSVTFTLYIGAGTSNPAPTAGYTVLAQLETSTTPGNWATCSVGSGGATTCNLPNTDQRKPLADVTGISVIAYNG